MKNFHTAVIFFVLILLSACAAPAVQVAEPGAPAAPVQSEPPASQPAEGAPAAPVSDAQADSPDSAQVGDAVSQDPHAPAPVGQGLPLISTRGDLFNASGNCAVCHTQMKDMAGNDVSNDSLWRATTMANAARDPYWQASVRREVLNSPANQEIIEDKCTACHMPMASFTLHTRGETGALLDQALGDPAHELHNLAIDGVSCSLCHQVQPDNFGDAESFSGGYLVDTQTPAGARIAYGPYPVGQNLVQIMQGVSGFIPQLGLHIEEAALCGTCHNLITPYLDASGQIAGEFPEQMIFSEWLHSSFGETKTCQGCHMPLAQGSVRLSTTGGPPRSPFYKHFFVGGNTYLPQLLQEYGAGLQVTASQAQLQVNIQNSETLLETMTANLKVENPTLADGRLSFDVSIENLAGHKLPAGYPSRRAWLHVAVLDSAGKVVFESGASGSDGGIQGNDNDLDGSKFEPHYLQIDSPDQVQIYEPVMIDTDGAVTTMLLRGAAYAKDNRLLPQGFDKASAPADIAVYGEALGDEDFTAGGDRVQYIVDLGTASGPFTIQVQLLYQSIGYRWAQNLDGYDSLETERFVAYYSALPDLPFQIAAVQIQDIK